MGAQQGRSPLASSASAMPKPKWLVVRNVVPFWVP